jgi:hypothetical protein
MTSESFLGFGGAVPRKPDDNPVEHVMIQHPLKRVLAFTHRTIDDVISDPFARNEVLGYYKLYRWIERESEIGDLERQWNPLSVR